MLKMDPLEVSVERAARRRSVQSAVSGERQRCAGIAEMMRNEWIKHTHQDEASRLVIEMLGKCAKRIREPAPTDYKI